MLKELATLKVNKSADYYGEIVKALEKDGFTVIESYDAMFEVHYTIAKEQNND